MKIRSIILGFAGLIGTVLTLGTVMLDPSLVGELYTARPLLFTLIAMTLVLIAGFWVRDSLWPLAAARLVTVRQFVVDWWESRPVAERRAYPVRAFIHLPEGQEPPDPVFSCKANGVKVLPPWRERPLLDNEDTVWACSAFAYTEGDGKRYAVTKSVTGGGEGVFSVQFSANSESWHIGSANADDRHSRYRWGSGHLTPALPIDPKQVRTPGNWFELFTVHVTRQSTYQSAPVEPFRLESIRELRAELIQRDHGQQSGAQGIAGDILYSPNDLSLTTTRGDEQFADLPPLSYLRFARLAEGGWSLSVGSARPMDLRSINDKGIDMVLQEDEPDSGIVDRVAYLSYGFRESMTNTSLKLYWR